MYGGMGSWNVHPVIGVFIYFALICSTQALLLIVDSSAPIGFTMAQTTHQHLVNGSLITYNKVITEKGTGQEYASPSVFTCIIPGLYKFQTYSLTKSDSEIWFELYKNDVLMVSLYGHNPNDYADSGNAVILKLTSGDRIYMKARDQYAVDLYGTTDEIYTTLTGVRLNSVPSMETPPAFSVALDRDAVVSSNHSVKFNKILLNTNNNYNKNTGNFTVPASGIYIFHIFALSEQDEELYLDLYVDKNYIWSLYGYTTKDYSDAGNTVILHLTAGQNVRVTARNGYQNSIYGAFDEVYSSFSGAMIADESNLMNGGGFVAFSAGLSLGYTVSGGATVVFNKIYTNIGNRYNTTSGRFTAPVSGLYEFSYHSLSEQSTAIWLELYHNAIYVNSLYSHTSGSYAAGGNAAVLQLAAGDQVFVKARVLNDNDLFGQSDQIYSTFSGYLLGATTGGVVIG